MKNSIFRRDFLRSSLAVGLGGMLAGQGMSSGYADRRTTLMAGGPKGRREKLEAAVVVVGGGVTGVCAALAAARSGVTTILIQDRPVLGGNSSSEIRMHILGADYSGVPHWRETGIIEELRLENQVRNPQHSPSMWDLILWERVNYQPNLTLLLNTVMTACSKESDLIRSIDCCQFRTERFFSVQGKVFIDCTGDGTLGYLAGNSYRVGREGRAEFGESLAPEKPEPYTMGNSLLFQARDMGTPMPFTAPEWAHKYPTDQDIGRNHKSFEYGYWWIEWGGMLDTIADDDRIREELLKILFGVWDHIKNHGDHGADNWALEWFGFLPGRRESRRLQGKYTLREQDITSGRIFPDEVAYGGWPIDDHRSQGFDYKKSDFYYQHRINKLYSVPLSSLYSTQVKNLFMGGRAISASHVAFSSTRVMATCALIGQGAGTAAAYCASRGIAPEQLSRTDLEAVKQEILKQDGYLLGTSNADLAELARKAKISSGSAKPGFEAAKVASGVARPVGDESNHWRSVSLAPEDAWLELDFSRNTSLSEIHLTFDTNLSRQMTLSQQKSVQEKMIQGPHPETVRDYRVEVFLDNTWKLVAVEKGNYQRKKVHLFSGLHCSKVRILVDATNGAPEARISEVRCYNCQKIK